MSANKRLLAQTSPECDQLQTPKRSSVRNMENSSHQIKNMAGIPAGIPLGNDGNQNMEFNLPKQQQIPPQQTPLAPAQLLVLPTQNACNQNQNAAYAVNTPNIGVSSGLPTDFWSTLSNVLDVKLDNVAKKEDLKQLREENQLLKNELLLMKSRLELLEQASKRSNLVVSGLAASFPNQAKDEFMQLCKSVLKCDVNVTSVRKISGGKSFVFNLNTTLEADSVISSRRLLKGSNVYIQKDTTAEERTKMFHLRALERNIKKADPNVKIRQGFARIYISDKPFYWIDGKYAATNETDATFLRNLVSCANFDAQIMVKPTTSRRTSPNQQATSSNSF